MNVTSQPELRASADGLVFRVATVADLSQLALWNRQLIEDEGHDNTMSLEELEARMRTWLTTPRNDSVGKASTLKATGLPALMLPTSDSSVLV